VLLATVITVITSTRTRWEGDEKIVCEILIGKSEMRYSLGDMHRWEYNVLKCCLKVTGFRFGQDSGGTGLRMCLVNALIDIRFTLKGIS